MTIIITTSLITNAFLRRIRRIGGAVAPQPEITLQLNTAYRQTSEFMQTETERRLHITIHGWSSGVPDEERNTMFLLHGVAGSSEVTR